MCPACEHTSSRGRNRPRRNGDTITKKGRMKILQQVYMFLTTITSVG